MVEKGRRQQCFFLLRAVRENPLLGVLQLVDGIFPESSHGVPFMGVCLGA